MPETPAGSSAAPTLYQTMCVTTGARWSGTTTTSSPLSKLKRRHVDAISRILGRLADA